jgi:hypothetical protein
MEARPSGLRAARPFAVLTDESADGTRGGNKTNKTGNRRVPVNIVAVEKKYVA